MQTEVLIKSEFRLHDRVFGVLFMLAGGAFISAIFPRTGPGSILLVPLLFVIGGFVILTWVRVVKVDPQRRTIRIGRGCIIPFFWKKVELLGDGEVSVREEIVHRGKGRTYRRYPIELSELGLLNHYFSTDKARRAAENVAKALQWRLCDSSSGQIVVREPHHLDESLRERFRRTGEEVPECPAPPQRLTVVEESPARWSISFPLPAFFHFTLGLIVIPMPLIHSGMFFILGRGIITPNFLTGAPFLMIPVAFLCWVLLQYPEKRITIDAQNLTYWQRLRILGRESTFVLPLYQVEECPLREAHDFGMPPQLRCFFRGRIRIISDEISVTVGEHLSNEELRAVHAELLRHIVR